MQFNTAGGSVTSPTGRWMSKKTWDYLTTALSTGVIQGLAAGSTLSLTGSVGQNGAVKTGAAWELPGEADADGSGPLTFEQLDAGGTVLQTRAFGAVNALGPIGNDTAKGDKHDRHRRRRVLAARPGAAAALARCASGAAATCCSRA